MYRTPLKWRAQQTNENFRVLYVTLSRILQRRNMRKRSAQPNVLWRLFRHRKRRRSRVRTIEAKKERFPFLLTRTQLSSAETLTQPHKSYQGDLRAASQIMPRLPEV